jgi:hypothetical protein
MDHNCGLGNVGGLVYLSEPGQGVVAVDHNGGPGQVGGLHLVHHTGTQASTTQAAVFNLLQTHKETVSKDYQGAFFSMHLKLKGV